MAKANQQEIIDFIINLLEKGQTREQILAKVAKKWQLSVRTFDRRLKTANIEHTNRQEMANKAANEAYIATKVNAAVGAVMSAQERKEVLTKIARGDLPLNKPMIVNGKIELVQVVPDWMDRRAAIAELNKMGGDYLTQKFDVTTNGEKITPEQTLNQSQFEQLLNKINEASTS